MLNENRIYYNISVATFFVTENQQVRINDEIELKMDVYLQKLKQV